MRPPKEYVLIDQTPFPNEGRSRRSRPSLLATKPLFAHVFERGGSGSTSRRQGKKHDEEEAAAIRTSRFPAVIAGQSVSYDPESRLFTVCGLDESRGLTYYFEDLPQDIRTGIQKLKISHPKE